jgi:hypothetical protein
MKKIALLFAGQGAQSRLFVKLPEIEFPRGFSWKKAFEMTLEIRSPARRTFVESALLSMRNSVNQIKHRR